MTLIAFCMALFSTVSILAIENGVGYLVGLMVFYLSSGFFVVFFTTLFFSLALRSRNPKLWAGMGRATNNAAAIIISAPSLPLMNTGNDTLIITVDLAVFAGIAVLLFAAGEIPRHPLIDGGSDSPESHSL